MATYEQVEKIEKGIINYEAIQMANSTIKTTAIQGKEYAEVNQRIKAFRMLYPQGFINTDMVSNDNGVCIFTASVGYVDEENRTHLLATGTAYEKENSTFINKTSYIENCETSAVGRALGMAGFGIDTSVASCEEVQNAMLNQEEKKATAKQVEMLSKYYQGDNLAKLLTANSIEKLEDMAMAKASELIAKITRKAAK